MTLGKQLTQHMNKHSKRVKARQGAGTKPKYVLNLPHPKLMCRIEPDVRPFEWPRRPRRKRDPNAPLEIGLYDADLIKFFRDLDELEGE